MWASTRSSFWCQIGRMSRSLLWMRNADSASVNWMYAFHSSSSLQSWTLLRSNVTDWSDEDLWKAYIQLTEAEAAFRIHKSDLHIRPIWHQKEERVLAHILVCFLAYVLWKTLAQICRAAGLGDEPRKVFEELSKVMLVEVALPTRTGVTISKRCVSRPTEHQGILLQRLGMHLPAALEFSGM